MPDLSAKRSATIPIRFLPAVAYRWFLNVGAADTRFDAIISSISLFSFKLFPILFMSESVVNFPTKAGLDVPA